MWICRPNRSRASPLPKGFKAERYEIAIHGVCPECAAKRKK